MDSINESSTPRIIDLLHYVSKQYGIDLSIRGGGYSCVDVQFAGPDGSAEVIADAITRDPHLQNILNELSIHYARIRSGDVTKMYFACASEMMGVVTNRKRSPDEIRNSANSINEYFLSDRSDELTYGTVQADIIDLASHQSKESLRQRTWKLITKRLQPARGQTLRSVDIKSFKEVDEVGFKTIISEFGKSGSTIYVHGYNSSLSSSLESCVLSSHLVRISRIGSFPILFSWSSAGNPLMYAEDVNQAEESELAFSSLVGSVVECNCEKVSIISYSHGSKLVVRSLLSSLSSGLYADTLILMSSDISARFIEQRAVELGRRFRRIVVYHNNDDLALKMSEVLFQASRLGSVGAGGSGAALWEVIDTSAVAGKGIASHSAHLDTAEIVADMHGILQGEPAERRYFIDPVQPAKGRWRLVNRV